MLQKLETRSATWLIILRPLRMLLTFDTKKLTLLRVLQYFIKDQKHEEVPILEEAEKRITQLEQQYRERERTESAAAASEVSKKILMQQQLPAKRPQFQENSVPDSSGPNIYPVETQTQRVVSSQCVRPARMQNQYQFSLSHTSGNYSDFTASCCEPMPSCHPDPSIPCTDYICWPS